MKTPVKRASALHLLVCATGFLAAPGTLHSAALTASDGSNNDDFGLSISASGSSGLVGAPRADSGPDDAGAAYFFRNVATSTGSVSETVKLIASDRAFNDQFGDSVGLTGSMALVGAFRQDSPRADQGAAYLFRNLDTAIGTVSQNAKLIVPAAQPMDFFGTAISLSGTTGLVGAAQASQGFGLPRGAAYYFRSLDTASGTVTPQVTLTPSPQPPDSRFGFSVSHSASVAVVGAPFADSSATQQGIAYVFRNLDTASGIVNQQLTLLASDASAMAQFGWSVSQSGTRALVGAPGVNSGTGAAYIFSELDSSSGTRTQQAKLVAFDQVQDDLFGQSVSLSGGLGLVGAVGAGEGRGAAYLFRNLETATGTLNAAIKITPLMERRPAYLVLQ